MTIGENIKNYRNKAGLTQRELGEKCGCATGTIQQYELGKRQPRIEQLRKIATALGVNISNLVVDWTVFSKDEISEDWDNASNNPRNEIAAKGYPIAEENGLIDDFRKLNTDGQHGARKRVQELTEIKRYTKQPAE